MTTQPITNDEITAFCANLQSKIITSMVERGFTCPTTLEVTIRFTEGGRFFRVLRCDPGSKSIYCLVDKNTGDIYKPTSYAGGPAKHVRGSIRTDWWQYPCGPYGIVNLR